MILLSTKNVDKMGRIVLPMAIREELNVGVGASVNICKDENGQYVIIPNRNKCKICGKTIKLIKLVSRDDYICEYCKNEISII